MSVESFLKSGFLRAKNEARNVEFLAKFGENLRIYLNLGQKFSILEQKFGNLKQKFGTNAEFVGIITTKGQKFDSI